MVKLDKKEKEVLYDYHTVLVNEETHWRQKSRVKWLQASDRNTRFFKMITFKHRAVKRITEIKQEDGTITQEIHKI